MSRDQDDDLRGLLAKVASALEQLGEPSEPSEFKASLPQLLKVQVDHRAPTLHLQAGAPPTLRLEGRLVPVGDLPLSRGDCRKLLGGLLNPNRREALHRGVEVDLFHQSQGASFKVHLYMERGQLAGTFRRLRAEIPTLEQLGLQLDPVPGLLQERQGLILLTGPPGCGKLNTQAALTSWINTHRACRILTLEQPIQFWHEHRRGLVTQREVGSDTTSHHHGFQQASRQDPDVIVCSDLPDRRTLEAALKAAGSGLLVIASVDSASAVRALDKLLFTLSHEGESEGALALSTHLRAILGQRLVLRADGRAHIPAFEVLVNSPEVSKRIRRGQVEELHWVMRQSGMLTLGRSLTRMVESGAVTLEEALKHVDGPGELELSEGEPEEDRPDDQTPLMSWL